MGQANMIYEEYLEKFREAQLSERISKKEIPWSKDIFEWVSKPIEKKEFPNALEKLTLKEIYLRIKKLCNEEQQKELEEIYKELDSNLNLE